MKWREEIEIEDTDAMYAGYWLLRKRRRKAELMLHMRITYCEYE